MSRAAAIGMLRQWGRHEVLRGKSVNTIYSALHGAMHNVLTEFLTEHEMPGVRYWHIPEDGTYFLTAPGERFPDGCVQAELAMELTRYEYLGRQGLHFDYLDNEL